MPNTGEPELQPMTDDEDDDESRFRSVIASIRDVLKGSFHSRHLYRPPED